MRITRQVVAVASFAFIVACAAYADRATRTIYGDVFVRTAGGDTKRGSGLTVLLLKDDHGAISRRLKHICDEANVLAAPMLRQAKRSADSAGSWMSDATTMDADGSHTRYGRILREAAKKELARAQELTDSVKQLSWRASAQMGLLADSATVARSSTGINASYRFSDLRPGDYAILAHWQRGDDGHVWLVPAKLVGDSLRVDLDNDALRGAPGCAPATR